MMNELIKYAKGMNVKPDVIEWLNTHASPYIEKHNPSQSEVEHIIDYMASEKRPERISKMSYVKAKSNAGKWVKALRKKGDGIKELPEDVEVIKDFEDGFKIVKLVGENAFKREGYLMRHCVASYFGKNADVYSLRDSRNMPHCTMEGGNQVKGKGNGSINPKYIKYVVTFLEEMGMSVRDSEMENLGYVNVEKIKNKLHPNKNKFFRDKYLFKDDEFIDVDGNTYQEFDLWTYKELVTKEGSDIKINFDLDSFIDAALSKLSNKNKAVANSEYSTAVAKGKNSLAVCRSADSKAKGGIGAWLIVCEYGENQEEIINIVTGKVDGVNIKEDVFYTAKDGELIEVCGN